MNKLVFAILACVAGCAFSQYIVRDSAGVKIDVPISGGSVVEVYPGDIPTLSEEASEASEAAFYLDFDEIEYTIYYYYGTFDGRSINATLYIDDREEDSHIFKGSQSSSATYTVPKESITNASSIVFTLTADCPLCLKSVTVIFWVRFRKDGKYFYDYSEDKPMPLYYTTYSPLFGVDKKKTKYFTYESTHDHDLYVRKYDDLDMGIELKFNKDDSKYKKEFSGYLEKVSFKKGVNSIEAYGKRADDSLFIQLGAFEDASSALKTFPFIFLCALFLILF